MYLQDKEKVLEVLESVIEAMEYIEGNIYAAEEFISLACELLENLEGYLIKKKEDKYIVEIQSIIDKFKDDTPINTEEELLDVVNIIKNNAMDIRSKVFEEETRFKVVFLPYKASMWTALESIWKAADEDPRCDAYVVPIPYYDLGGNQPIYCYEKNEYPSYVPVIDYREFSVQDEEPEIIYIHNPYDDTNNLTRVPKEYYSRNLKGYTKCLVYSPYFTIGSYVPGMSNYHYLNAGSKNADKIVVQCEAAKKIYKQYGYAEERLITYGSPKVDAVVNRLQEPLELEEEWREKLKDKYVFLMNTHLSYFPKAVSENRQDIFEHYEAIVEDILQRQNCALIWRPHPLLKSMLEERFPQCAEFIQKIEDKVASADNGIVDKTSDYIKSFKCSHAMVTTYSSLLNEYMITGKPAYILDESQTKESHDRSPLKRNYNYFLFGEKITPWNEFIDMVFKEEDPMYEKRKETVKQAFTTLDGSVGIKIHKEVIDTLMDK